MRCVGSCGRGPRAMIVSIDWRSVMGSSRACGVGVRRGRKDSRMRRCGDGDMRDKENRKEKVERQ